MSIQDWQTAVRLSFQKMQLPNKGRGQASA